MRIVTDLKYIEQYAAEHEEENCEFRAFLKYRDFENQKVKYLINYLVHF